MMYFLRPSLVLFLIAASLTVLIKADDKCEVISIRDGSKKYIEFEDFRGQRCWTHEIYVVGNETDYVYDFYACVDCTNMKYPILIEMRNGDLKESYALAGDGDLIDGFTFRVPEKFEGRTQVSFKTLCEPKNMQTYRLTEIKYYTSNRTPPTFGDVVITGDTNLDFATNFTADEKTSVAILAPKGSQIMMRFGLYTGNHRNGPTVSFIEGPAFKDGLVTNISRNSQSWFRSKGNEIKMILSPNPADSFPVNVSIVRSQVYVLNGDLDCLFEVRHEECKWHIERDDRYRYHHDRPPRSTDLLMQQSDVKIKEPLCLSINYDSEMASKDVFFVVMETKNTSHVLFKKFGGSKRWNKQKRLVDFTIPAYGLGTISMYLKRETTESRIGVISIKSKPGHCHDPEISIDCVFKKTLCGWNVIQDRIVKYELSDKLSLKRGGSIIGPKMTTGKSCFEFTVSGKGRLSLLVMEGAKDVLRRSYLVDTSILETRRIILKDIKETTRIILEARGLINLTEEANVEIYKTLLLPEAECQPDKGRFNGEIKVKHDLVAIGNDSVLIHVKLTDESNYSLDETDYVSAKISELESKKWFCYRYRLLTPVVNNICFTVKTKTIGEVEGNVVWRQCSTVYRSETVNCFALPAIKNELMVYGLIQTIDVLSEGKISVSKPKDIYTNLLISSYWIQDKPECTVHNFKCGWSQPKRMAVGTWHAEEEQLALYPIFETSKDSDFILSPPFYVDSPSDVCVQFTLQTEQLTNVHISIEQGVGNLFDERIVTVNPNKTNEISQTLHLQEGINNIGLALSTFEGDIWNKTKYVKVFELKFESCQQAYEYDLNLNCEFDSDICGWDIETRYSIQNFTIFYANKQIQNDLIPEVDGKMKGNGSYVSLYSSDSYGNVEYATATSPTYTPSTDTQCVQFYYFMTGSDAIEHVLHLNLETEVAPDENIWSKEDSQVMSWFKVQFPINSTEAFRLKFYVDSVSQNETSEFVVLFDSVSVSEGTHCQSFQEQVSWDQFLLANILL